MRELIELLKGKRKIKEHIKEKFIISVIGLGITIFMYVFALGLITLMNMIYN